MDKQNIKRFAQSLIIIPFLTTALPFGAVGQGKVTDFVAMNIQEKVRFERAQVIDTYFKERKMPLEGLGEKFILEAEKHGLDWRLLPAIAIRESSGGKKACGSNPFGWASCRKAFKDFNQSIEIVALNLGGRNPKTASYYGESDTYEKLYRYNGTVIKSYPSEVVAIMEKIGSYE